MSRRTAELIARVERKLYLRRCRGDCHDLSFHTHHLTRLGMWHFTRVGAPRRRRITAHLIVGVFLAVLCFSVAVFDAVIAVTEPGHQAFWLLVALVAAAGAINAGIAVREWRRS